MKKLIIKIRIYIFIYIYILPEIIAHVGISKLMFIGLLKTNMHCLKIQKLRRAYFSYKIHDRVEF